MILYSLLIDDAMSKGAVVHCGGKRNKGKSIARDGQFYMATLLSGVTPDMRIWKEEVF